jgi:uncharacterized protein (DUF488 family)
MDVFTIGYERRTVSELIEMLQAAGVDRLIDVRALPLSRRKGFSKTPLREALAEVGIDYVHLRSAGNPFRDQRDDPERCLALYAAHVRRSPEIVDDVLAAAKGHRAALFCLERDASTCHRSVLAAQLVRARTRVRVHDLATDPEDDRGRSRNRTV